jgi:hypothetical protein
MLHDLRLRAAVCAIYDTVYPGPEWTPVPFAEAERLRTVHYRQAVAAALKARNEFVDEGEQLALI